MIFQTIKSVHIIAMVAWFAGLLYLPRLFVYHAQAQEQADYQRFCVMERKLYKSIMTPAAMVTVVSGIGLMHFFISSGGSLGLWFILKLGCVTLLLVFHLRCGRFIKQFAAKQPLTTEKYFRYFNEIPAILLIAIIVLVEFQNNLFQSP